MYVDIPHIFLYNIMTKYDLHSKHRSIHNKHQLITILQYYNTTLNQHM